MLAASLAAGIEAPVRFYLLENSDGSATLAYRPPGVVFTPYFNEGGSELRKLAAELDAPRPTAAADAVSALVNLGYGQAQAGAAVSAAMRKAGDDQPTEKLIRLALKELALA
jgi:hypothetical protein